MHAAVAAGNDDFETLVTAVQAADLVDVLASDGPFTVFAPTDEAFAKLPAGTVENLLKPENIDQLKSILTYHVVAGEVPASQVVTLPHDDELAFAHWSPDGSRLITATLDSYQAQLWTADGVPSRTLEHEYALTAAAFSPDGARVAYITAHEGVPQVWLAAADGSDRQPLTSFPDQVTGVAWQPATVEPGSDTVPGALAILVAPGGGLNSQLYLMPADGSEEPQMITAGGQVICGGIVSLTVICWVQVTKLPQLSVAWRSEERRVGKECRYRWSPYH
mgnify:CR=1 FL=1